MKCCNLSHMNVMRVLEPVDLKNFVRMDMECFEELLKMVTPLNQKQDMILQKSISPRERLIATL